MNAFFSFSKVSSGQTKVRMMCLIVDDVAGTEMLQHVVVDIIHFFKLLLPRYWYENMPAVTLSL